MDAINLSQNNFDRGILRRASNRSIVHIHSLVYSVHCALKHELRNRLRIVHKLPNNGLMICVLIYFIIQLRRSHCLLTMTTTCIVHNSEPSFFLSLFCVFVFFFLIYLNQKNINVPIFSLMHFNSIICSFPSHR